MRKLYIIFIAFCLLSACKNAVPVAEDIPILAWYSIPPEHTSVERYMELRDAGFTHSLSFFPDTVKLREALNAAHKANIKIIASCPELKSATEETVKKIMNHPSLAAYMLRDEPSRKDFPELGDWARKIGSADSSHFCYLNLFPNYASEEQLGTKTYQEHVDLFIREIPLKIISFDHYPVVGDSLRANWYENLEVVSKAAKDAGKPFWAFTLSVAHGPYPIPTLAQMRLQVFSDLAYGAQGIEYFTYWTPPYDTTWKFNNGPVTVDGKITPTYEKVKQLNKEIKALSSVFYGSKVISVMHAGNEIPIGTKPLENLPDNISDLKIEGTGAVVSILENGKNNYLIIVNRDFLKPMKLSVNLKKGFKMVMRDGSLKRCNEGINQVVSEPGDITVFKWEN